MIFKHSFSLIKTICTVFSIFVVCAVVIVMPTQAVAQCLPGLPCSEILTPGQLLDPSTGPNAAKSDRNSCDANFMNQIYAKAFLEAERETVIKNAIILKPDSVLEYSCFDHLAARVATHAGPLFSELLTPESLDEIINVLVLESLVKYGENFSHDFLGGAATDDNHIFSPTTTGVQGACDYMNNIFYIAKCDDFALNAPFMTFEQLLTTDPRLLPYSCPTPLRVSAELIATANNQDRLYASFDPLETLLYIMSPPFAGLCENATPIPTGVIVSYQENDQDLAGNPITVEAYSSDKVCCSDKVCSNPGCYFDHGGDSDPGNDRCVP